MAELSVILKGEIDDLEKSLNRAQDLLEDTGEVAEESSDKITKSTSGTSKGADKAKGSIKELSDQLIDASGASTKFSSSAEGVASALGASGGVTGAVTLAVAGLALLIDYYKDLIKQQTEFARGQTKGIENAKAEIVTLESLLSIARDLNTSQDTRQKALDRINEEYSDYLPNLTEENLNTKKVTSAIDTYTEALIRNAKIKAAQNLISDEFAKILDLEAKGAIGNASALDFLVAGLQSYGQQATFTSNLIVQGFKTQQGEISESEKRIESLKKVLSSLLQVDLLSPITAGASPDAPELPKNNFRDLGEIFAVDESKITGVFVDPVRKELGALGILLDQQPALLQPKISNIEQFFRDFNADLTNIFSTSSVSSAISDFSTVIGNQLANGANLFQALGSGVLNLFSGFLGKMGDLLIKYGTLAVAKGKIDIAIKAGGPIAIGAGIAAIAVGVALKGASAALSSAASGSNLSGQGSIGSFSGGSASSVSTLSGGNVVFRIRGRDLIGVIENEQQATRRLGG